ncbi:MAG: divergent PAP2 family protein [Ruminococcaceae bacterium]|nr:divergent PAP2 family protein [Oscillospiraceae bacterium]
MENVLNGLKAFTGNYMLISGIFGWFIAQVIKIIINLCVFKKFDIKLMFANGGMPSSHSATVVALSTAAAISYGLGSAQFAISAILSVIVINDALGVRQQAGKQAKVINLMVGKIFKNDEAHGDSESGVGEKLKELVGHTPIQVVLGALLGLTVAIVYALIVKGVTGSLPIM